MTVPSNAGKSPESDFVAEVAEAVADLEKYAEAVRGKDLSPFVVTVSDKMKAEMEANGWKFGRTREPPREFPAVESEGVNVINGLRDRIAAYFGGKEALDEWLDRPNPAFDDRVPRTLLFTPEGRKELENMLYLLDSGTPD